LVNLCTVLCFRDVGDFRPGCIKRPWRLGQKIYEIRTFYSRRLTKPGRARARRAGGSAPHLRSTLVIFVYAYIHIYINGLYIYLYKHTMYMYNFHM
jgi:hypothetical protein